MPRLEFDALEDRMMMDAAALVRGLYIGMLERDPAQAEQSYWTDKLAAQTLTESDVVRQFETSIERRSLVVMHAYHDLMNRSPDPAGLKYFSDYLAADGSPQRMRGILAGSDEYWKRHSIPFNNQAWNTRAFLDGLYTEILGRNSDDAGLGYWSKALADGMSRTNVATGFALSHEGLSGLVDYWTENRLHRPAQPANRDQIVVQIQAGGNDDTAYAAIVGSKENQSIIENLLILEGNTQSRLKAKEYELPPTDTSGAVPIVAHYEGIVPPGPRPIVQFGELQVFPAPLYHGPQDDQQVIDQRGSWTNLWVNVYGQTTPVPDIDFDKYIVVTATSSLLKSNGAAAIEDVRQGASLEVHVREFEPGSILYTDQIPQYYAIAVVPKTTTPVHFSYYYVDSTGVPRLPDAPNGSTNLPAPSSLPSAGIANPYAGAFVIRNADDWATTIHTLSDSLAATAPLPEIDFNKSMIIGFNHVSRSATLSALGADREFIVDDDAFKKQGDQVFADIQFSTNPNDGPAEMFLRFFIVDRFEGQVTFRFSPIGA